MTFIATKLFHKAGEGSGGGGGGDQHNLGWYATQSALETAHPTATAGDWAIVGSTDTVWLWDTDNEEWVDSDQKGQVTSVNGQTGVVSLGINDVAPTQTGKSGYVLGTDGFVAGWVKPEIVQVSALPAASEDEVDNIYQFVGTTDANYTNGYFYKCVSDGGNPATYSWSNIQVQAGGGSSYTAGTGIDITSGIISVTSPTLTNTATGSNSLAILTNTTSNDSVAVGKNSSAAQLRATAYGTNAIAGGQYSFAAGAYAKADTNTTGSTAVGCQALVYYGNRYSVAIGYDAQVTAQNAIQINASGISNQGRNTDANTFKVANVNGNYEIMSADGTIPTDRFTTTPSADGTYVPTLTISSGVASRSWSAPSGGSPTTTTATLAVNDWSNNSQTVNVTGVTASNLVQVAPAPSSNSDYVSGGVLCTAQGSGTLTFTCTTTPTSAITVNVVIFG